MTNEQATRRFLGVVIPGAIVFVGASFVIKTASEAGLLPAPALYAVAIVPVVILLAMFGAQWRYMSEIDEFLRSIQVKAAFAALTALMTVATGWGYLEFYAAAPPLSIFWLNPLYWVAYSLSSVIVTLRSGAVS